MTTQHTQDSLELDKEIIEQLADIEHQRWADWQKHVHSKCVPSADDGIWQIGEEFIKRWQRQINTPYAELSETEKQSDREQVARYLPIIESFIRQVESAAITRTRKETEKAFGGCTKCYGKGYSTVSEHASSRLGTWKLPSMKFCDCERGSALKQEVSQVRKDMVDGIEKLRMRFRCGACDGAKCEHTQCCQALSALENLNNNNK